jgi:hypothetical protein
VETFTNEDLLFQGELLHLKNLDSTLRLVAADLKNKKVMIEKMLLESKDTKSNYETSVMIENIATLKDEYDATVNTFISYKDKYEAQAKNVIVMIIKRVTQCTTPSYME